MTKEEIRNVLAQIKIMYPRFESVEKEGGQFKILPAVIDAWFKRLGWMDADRALAILDRHMESEEGNKTPTLSLWLRNGKAQSRAADGSSASLDRQHGVIRWQPEPEGDVFEIPVSWSNQHGAWEDYEGRLWAMPGEE